MTTTSHGHHIQGSPFEDEEGFIPLTRRCGGPGLCDTCSLESAQLRVAMEERPDNFDHEVEEKDFVKFFEDPSEYDQDPDRYLKLAKLAVIGSYNSTHEIPDQLTEDQLYIVWFAKTLSTWKALISTSVAGDGLYFEVTYSAEKLETYVDTYRKEDNQVFSHHDH